MAGHQFSRWLLMVWAGLLVCQAWAQATPPRLLAVVRVPKGTLRGWVHGQYFGIDGLWDYVDEVESREWCWWGPGRAVFQPLPRKQYIVRVDGVSLSAYYQDGKDYLKCHRWSRGPDGRYRATAAPYTRIYGSDTSMAYPHQVSLPGYKQSYEVFDGGVSLKSARHKKERRIKGVGRDCILVMQPEKHQILALGTETELLLLDSDLATFAKLRLGAVRNLRFDRSGERLAVVTRDDRLWILEVTPRHLGWSPSLDRLWRPRAEITPDEFNRLADQWEAGSGRSWWSPQAYP